MVEGATDQAELCLVGPDIDRRRRDHVNRTGTAPARNGHLRPLRRRRDSTPTAGAGGVDAGTGGTEPSTCTPGAPASTRSRLAGLGGDDTIDAPNFPDGDPLVELGGEGSDTSDGGPSEDILVDGPGNGADTLNAAPATTRSSTTAAPTNSKAEPATTSSSRSRSATARRSAAAAAARTIATTRPGRSSALPAGLGVEPRPTGPGGSRRRRIAELPGRDARPPGRDRGPRGLATQRRAGRRRRPEPAARPHRRRQLLALGGRRHDPRQLGIARRGDRLRRRHRHGDRSTCPRSATRRRSNARASTASRQANTKNRPCCRPARGRTGAAEPSAPKSDAGADRRTTPKPKPDRTPPRTKLLGHPAKTFRAARGKRAAVAIRFAASERSHFECKLDAPRLPRLPLPVPRPPRRGPPHLPRLRDRRRRQPRPHPGPGPPPRHRPPPLAGDPHPRRVRPGNQLLTGGP